MSEATSELWDVRFSGGEIRSMTLEQMDAAYQADAIGEETPVRAAGSQKWTTLGVAAGISNAPVAVAESAFTAPFSATAPFSPFAPSGTPFGGFSPVAPDAPSLRPLVSDLDAAEVDPADVELDSDADLESAFRPPPRNKKVAFAFGAVALLFVFGLGANHLRKGSSAPAATLVAAAQPPSPPPASTIPPPTLVAPLASAPRTSEPLAAPPPAKPSKKTKARSLRRK